MFDKIAQIKVDTISIVERVKNIPDETKQKKLAATLIKFLKTI